MGKPQKKKNVADKVRKTKTSTEIKNNPFEVKVNRKKFDILGRKGKHDVGLPGVSRSKAINKRKNTLLKEYKQKGKANKFIDRRFGEYDTKMAPEDKILQRFSMERQRTLEKKDMYNLNEDEELTHYGQSLAEMEKLNDIVDSDSDSEEKGLLSAELTASHFGGGGGLLRKKGPGEKGDKGRSRQELIDELIIKSKQEKRERQTQKEESHVLTEKLDQEWKSIQGLLSHKGSRAQSQDQTEKPKLDDYDMMVRELGFEMKAQPSEKLKSEEELAREERERLQNLEADRLRRMRGEAAESSKKKAVHFSADDLNDGFILDKEDKKMLAYKDGKWSVGEEKEEKEDVEGEEGESGEEEEVEEDDEEAEEDSEDGDDSDDDEEDSDEDAHSDLESEQGSAREEEELEKDEEELPAASASCQLSEEELKAQQEAAKAELPYTFKAPDNTEELKDMLQGHSPLIQRLILERTLKSNHPSLAVGNKLKLQKMFGFLLEYMGELASSKPPELNTVNILTPQLYGLCQLFPAAACKAMQTLLGDSAHGIEETVEVTGRAPFPGLDTLIYLKITALLFPTSDFRHPVTIPAFLCISQALTQCPVTSLQDVTCGLVLCCLALEYVTLSRRLFPEVVNFLLGVLHLAVPDKTTLGFSVVSPFKQVGRNAELLVLNTPEATEGWSRTPLRLSAVQGLQLHSDLEKDHYRLSLLNTCLDLVKRCAVLYKDTTSIFHIFQPIRAALAHLPLKNYPAPLQELHREVLEALPETPAQQLPLVFDKKKPIPLKLLTPKIVQVLDYGKKRGNTKEQREQERLKHKYKKEFKGALREIRKDTRFLAREKLSDVMKRDSERKRKVKELMGSLSTQEGEWKALKKMKRK
ncbi:nucleolar protein 14 [Clupea harengus]|uniref:Nucleolar protein 14 n=1 Tax=Clupea harengus TaxID=7950 RepID=A0A6P3WD48_CLUHA|nr:nucleolar protein 14 [Clupea harengus]